MSGNDYDIVVVGGGPIGAAVAIALQGSGLSALVLEARPDAGGSNDPRTLAMSYGSRLILERLGIWSQIEPVTPIESIHVSQRGGFGRTLLRADEAGLPALGYVVRYAGLQQAFGRALESEHTALICGAEVTAMESITDGIDIRYRGRESSKSIAARLLVIADGGASTGLRAQATMRVREYGQDALVGFVGTSQPHGCRAYERFTPDGPIALLPFENRYALVLTAMPETVDRLIELRAPDFLEQLQRHFGDRAGRFTSIEARARFALMLRYAADPVLPRAVMLGNAAQALHPIAGQGFNLGLRDAWELGETVLLHGTRDPGCDECLLRYRALRRPDRLRGIALTHSLVKIFSNDYAPLRATRGAALSLLELFPPAKRAFMQSMVFGASR
ncbi:MAG TPA: FAD-dependent monooxygenase [Burkholderiales bacterium]|nr:FAD-dependent monooxygenase [Burkholderiales bacterium]